MKKYLCTMVTIVIIISLLGVPSVAKSDTVLNYVNGMYGFEVITYDDLPEGVTPIKLNSIAELESYLETLNKHRLLPYQGNPEIAGDGTITPFGLWYPVTGSDDRVISTDNFSYTLRSEIYFTRQWDDTNSRWLYCSVDSKNIYFSKSLNASWEQEAYNATITSNNTSISVYIRGNVYFFIDIDGNIFKTLVERLNTTYYIS